VNENIVGRLAELRPEVCGGWKAETVTAALKPFGINVIDVLSAPDGGGKSTTRRGIERREIVAAVEARKRPKTGA
jgi:S-DNA-T family DNA segregation ATPase FtsK/SpoIIIE